MLEDLIRKPQPQDWPEDAHLENGSYHNYCVCCSCNFIGYKRRCVCKVCHEKYEKQGAAHASIIDGYKHQEQQL